MRGRIRGNKIGPVLAVKIGCHQKRHGVEIRIESLPGDKTASWVLIMSGSNKYVKEAAETIPIESLGSSCAGKPAIRSKAKPKQTPTDTPSRAAIKDEVKQESDGQMSSPHHERQWIDIEPAEFNQGCLEISKFIIRLLRRDQDILRERDGAVRYGDLLHRAGANRVHKEKTNKRCK